MNDELYQLVYQFLLGTAFRSRKPMFVTKCCKKIIILWPVNSLHIQIVTMLIFVAFKRLTSALQVLQIIIIIINIFVKRHRQSYRGADVNILVLIR